MLDRQERLLHMPYVFQNKELIPSVILQADEIFTLDKDRAYYMLRELCLSLNNRISSIEHTKCNVFIPAPKFPCPASLTLENEGIDFVGVLMTDEYSYGNFMADEWKKEEPFIVLEHDIAPYPEAIKDIMWCDHPWCAYEYYHHEGYKLYAMGCIKFSRYIIENSQDMPNKHGWRFNNWITLDSAIIPPLTERYGRPHIHYPPVAHVK